MTAIVYTIYEQPQPPLSDNPALKNPTPGKAILENPTTENPTQLNKEIQRTDLPTKEKTITDGQSTHAIPILSQSNCENRFTPTPYDGEASKEPERKRKEASTQSAVEIQQEIIKDNIDYDIHILDNDMEKERTDEIVDIMLELVCTARKSVRIAGDDYRAELSESLPLSILELTSSVMYLADFFLHP